MLTRSVFSNVSNIRFQERHVYLAPCLLESFVSFILQNFTLVITVDVNHTNKKQIFEILKPLPISGFPLRGLERHFTIYLSYLLFQLIAQKMCQISLKAGQNVKVSTNIIFSTFQRLLSKLRNLLSFNNR